MTYIRHWRTYRGLTLDQLLRMNSGLWTDGPGNRTDSLYWGCSTVPETAAAAPLEAAPGSHFNYANSDFLLATCSLMNTLGADAPDARFDIGRFAHDALGVLKGEDGRQ